MLLTNDQIEFSEEAMQIQIKIVELTKEKDFNLLLVFEKNVSEHRTLRFLSILYKDSFYTKTYAEARYYIESMKIFADQKYADLDTEDFEIREKKDEKGRLNHTFFCKFIKNENVYLSRAKAKTIATVFLESTFSFNKQNIFEKELMEFPIHFTRHEIPETIKKILENKIQEITKANFSEDLKHHLSSTLTNMYQKKECSV